MNKKEYGDWLKDGGGKSRKLWFSIFSALLVLVGGIMAAKWEHFGEHYTIYVEGIVAIAGLLLGANVTSRWASSKHVVGKSVTKTSSTSDEEVPKFESEKLED